MSLNLAGTGSFAVVPVGRNSEMTLNSNWPHPGFMGDYLPVKHRLVILVSRRTGRAAGLQTTWRAGSTVAGMGDPGL
jgi:inner membrane protein